MLPMCSCQRTVRTAFAKLFAPVEFASVKSFCRKWLVEPQLELLSSPGSLARLRFRSGAAASLSLRFGRRLVGVTGVEPVTLRLSSACSNQLSYTPAYALCASARQAPNRRSEPAPAVGLSSRSPKEAEADAAAWLSAALRAEAGGAEETRTPDL